MRLGLGLGVEKLSGGIGWTPLELSPIIWLDGNDSSYIVESGGKVSQWSDKSGNSNNLVQSTEDKKPTFSTNKVVFDEDSPTNVNADSLGINPIPSAMQGEISIFLVKKSSDIEAIDFIDGTSNYGMTYESGGTAGAFVNMGTPSIYKNGNSVTISTRGDAFTQFQDNTFNIVEYITADLTVWGKFDIFAPYFQFSQGGEIHELVIVDGTLSADDRENIEGYLAWKWGLVSKLPAGHTYKTDSSKFSF